MRRQPALARTLGIMGAVLWFSSVARADPPRSPPGANSADTGEATAPAAAVPIDTAAPIATATIAVPTTTSAPTTAPPRQSVRLLAVGDVLFGRYDLEQTYRRVVHDERPFANVQDLLATGDIKFANLECPMREQPTRFHTTQTLTFRAQPSDADILAKAGFDVLSVANNHARDLGVDSVLESRRHLEAANLAVIGGGATMEQALRPVILKRNGVRVAMIAWTTWLNSERQSNKSAVAFVDTRVARRTIAAEIRRLRRRRIADVIVVSLHWGHEYEPEPRDYQRDIARAAIDAGATVILGHHPHVAQKIERYRDGLIAYSLGNFLWDNPQTRQRQTLVLDLVIERMERGARVTDVVVHPVIIDEETHMPTLVNAIRPGDSAGSDSDSDSADSDSADSDSDSDSADSDSAGSDSVGSDSNSADSDSDAQRAPDQTWPAQLQRLAPDATIAE